MWWYHNGDRIDYRRRRGQRIYKGEDELKRSVTKLIINKAESRDSGNYTCKVTGAQPVTITVHVNKGKLVINKAESLDSGNYTCKVTGV